VGWPLRWPSGPLLLAQASQKCGVGYSLRSCWDGKKLSTAGGEASGSQQESGQRAFGRKRPSSSGSWWEQTASLLASQPKTKWEGFSFRRPRTEAVWIRTRTGPGNVLRPLGDVRRVKPPRRCAVKKGSALLLAQETAGRPLHDRGLLAMSAAAGGQLRRDASGAVVAPVYDAKGGGLNRGGARLSRLAPIRPNFGRK